LSPDTRQHRGANPADSELFSDACLAAIRTTVTELSWLLTRGYSAKAALKLVGDKHRLTERQRLAVARAACADQSLALRSSTRQPLELIQGHEIIIDGFNVIITVEAALSGGVILLCRDDCVRDLSSVHGSYRAVSETKQAIILIGEALEELNVNSAQWILDRPISNSGRLAKRIRDLANERGWTWSVELEFNPDKRIAASQKIAITSDSVVLDRVAKWVNFKRHLIETRLAQSWIVDLRA